MCGGWFEKKWKKNNMNPTTMKSSMCGTWHEYVWHCIQTMSVYSHENLVCILLVSWFIRNILTKIDMKLTFSPRPATNKVGACVCEIFLVWKEKEAARNE